jgi:hypothetical protein
VRVDHKTNRSVACRATGQHIPMIGLQLMGRCELAGECNFFCPAMGAIMNEDSHGK